MGKALNRFIGKPVHGNLGSQLNSLFTVPPTYLRLYETKFSRRCSCGFFFIYCLYDDMYTAKLTQVYGGDL